MDLVNTNDRSRAHMDNSTIFSTAFKTLLVVACLSASTLTQGQLYVQEGVIVHLNTTLTSQAEYNEINANIGGEGTLVFNASTPQTIVSNEAVHVPSLLFNNPTSIYMDARFVVNGDVEVENSVVYVLQPMHIHGTLTLGSNSVIFGKAHITIETELETISLSVNTHTTVQHVFIAADLTEHLPHTDLQLQRVEKSSQAFRLTCIAVPTPPPNFQPRPLTLS